MTDKTFAGVEDYYSNVPSTFLSPFSPSYTEGLNVRTNPPKAAGTGLTNAECIQVAGLIVNKKWDKAIRLVRDLQKSLKAKGAKSTAGTFLANLSKLEDYLVSVKSGSEHPVRRIDRTDGKALKKRAKFKKGTYKAASGVVSLREEAAGKALDSKGNKKLPFAAYSEFPVVTCPGAGAVSNMFGDTDKLGAAVVTKRSPEDTVSGCAAWCYSFQALRYANVFHRWALLTLSSTVDPYGHAMMVMEQMLKLYKGRNKIRIMRLFVDGDFASTTHVHAWMEAIKWAYKESDGRIIVYGYSKSWKEILDLARRRYKFPSNYVLNLSSGSLHNDRTLASMKRLKISRGRFVAVALLERLLVRSLGAKKGKATFDAFQDRTKHMDKKTKKYQQEFTALLEVVRKKRPDFYQAWLDFERRAAALKSSAAVRKKLKQLTGYAFGSGDAKQEAEAILLRALDAGKPGNFACPIECGSCPWGRLSNRQDEIVEHALGATELSPKAAKALRWRANEKQRGRVMHACGNIRTKQDINIGIH